MYIMFIEDNPELRMVYSTFLKKNWISVLECEDWVQALNEIENHSFDLILMDIMMPKMDWLEFVEKLTELVPAFELDKIKIWAFSNVADISSVKNKRISKRLVKSSTPPSRLLKIIKEEFSLT